MKSPFAIFRKHQKILMVVLTGLAMFAFVVLDSLTQNMEAFPPIFGCLVGIGLAWGIARKQKSVLAWVAIGGVAGALLGSMFQAGATTQAAVKTSFGDISNDELNNAIGRRQLVNRFLVEAFRAAHAGEENPPTFMLDQLLFGGNGDQREEALMHILMMKEAERLNLQIGNDAVSNLIDQATSGKLSSDQYLDVLREARLSDKELFDLIKEQLIGQTVRRAMAPRYSPSPGDFWKAYSQLNVREELAVVPIAVASFEKLVGEPDQSALKELFEKYRDKVPTMTEPGFRQPGRIQLAYLEVDFEKVGQTVPEVTDAEVKAYYEANKENYRNFANRAFPSESEMPEAGSSAAGTTPFDGPALVAPAMTSTPAEATTSQPSPEKTTPAAVTPPAGTSTPAPAGTSVAPPAGTSAASPAGTSETSAISQRPFGESLANILDEAPPATTSDVPPPAGTSVELPAPATTSETPKAPEPEYRPLDETLKERIRTQLKTERVLKKMEEISAAARGELFKINSRYAGVADGEKESVVQEMDAATQAYAKEHGLRYSKTPFYSFDELSKSEDHPIGSSTEPSANRFERTEARTVSEQHFGVEDVEALERQRYLVFEAEDPRTLNRFLHWQIGFQDSHTPTWEEEGVPEQVREAWINQEAQKLAEKRASEVAEMLRKSEATWSETLAEVNETGQEGSQSLIVTYSNQFSWLTPSSAPRSNPLAPPVLEISDVPIILGGADNEFMETVFEKLGPGEIGTVWSSNRHYVNVVRVDNRTNVEEVRNQFLQSSNSLFSPFAPFQNMMMNDGRRVVIQWNTKLYDEFDVEWVRDNEK